MAQRFVIHFYDIVSTKWNLVHCMLNHTAFQTLIIIQQLNVNFHCCEYFPLFDIENKNTLQKINS